MRIFVLPVFENARKAPIQNRHFDSVGIRSHSEISGPAPKFLSRSMVAGCRCDRIRTPLRSNGHNVPLGDKTSFRRQKTFVSHYENVILSDDLPDSMVFLQ
ncbi:hypothetical protein Taro_047236 [Colocasia esculenta]|uniref:Uncharacterized protein n=1 Tax=Colocasia esculenta TaxID=4460 RepID=A0A843X6H0_COLES|nr:hypothetical protein [Colocasia esculenta]